MSWKDEIRKDVPGQTEQWYDSYQWLYDDSLPEPVGILPSKRESKLDLYGYRESAYTVEEPKKQYNKPFVLISDNPQDKLQEIIDKLQDGIKDIFSSTQYKEYLKTVAKFHNYSFNNCLLIAMQKPDATLVGGYKFWSDVMNRPVMNGEKGIKIIAPAPQKKKKHIDILDENGKPVLNKDGTKKTKQEIITIPAFKVVTIFDVSQTDGEPLPELGKNQLTGSVEQYNDFFTALEETSPVPVRFEKIDSNANGYYDMTEKRIVINEGMSELQNLKTLIHEIAHVRVHDPEFSKSGNTTRPDRKTKEVEAESIAYTVCQHYGLDTSEYSFAYIATWSGDKELNALKASLDTIRTEANEIINETDNNFMAIQNERYQHSEKPYRIEGIQNVVNSLDEMQTKLEKIEPDSPKAESTYESCKEMFRVAEAQVPGGYTVLKDMINHVAQSQNLVEMKDHISEMKSEFEKRLPAQYMMKGYDEANIKNDKNAMIQKIMAYIVKTDPEHPIKSLRYIERNMRRKSVDEIRDIDYKFYFPDKTSKIAEPERPYIRDMLQAYKKQAAQQKPNQIKQHSKSTVLEK